MIADPRQLQKVSDDTFDLSVAAFFDRFFVAWEVK
jgi:hypothetical protein